MSVLATVVVFIVSVAIGWPLVTWLYVRHRAWYVVLLLASAAWVLVTGWWWQELLLTVIVFVTVRVARTVHGWVLRHHHVTTLTHVEAGTVIMTKDEL